MHHERCITNFASPKLFDELASRKLRDGAVRLGAPPPCGPGLLPPKPLTSRRVLVLSRILAGGGSGGLCAGPGPPERLLAGAPFGGESPPSPPPHFFVKPGGGGAPGAGPSGTPGGGWTAGRCGARGSMRCPRPPTPDLTPSSLPYPPPPPPPPSSARRLGGMVPTAGPSLRAQRRSAVLPWSPSAVGTGVLPDRGAPGVGRGLAGALSGVSWGGWLRRRGQGRRGL